MRISYHAKIIKFPMIQVGSMWSTEEGKLTCSLLKEKSRMTKLQRFSEISSRGLLLLATRGRVTGYDKVHGVGGRQVEL